MTRLDALSDGFKLKYEKFLISCDMQENLDAWDKNEYGEMDVFFQNHLVVFILRLVVADGIISEKEVEYINKTFGFNYSKEALAEAYADCKEVLGGEYDVQLKRDLAELKSINENLALRYVDLVESICNIIIQSDGVIDQREMGEARKILGVIQQQ